MRQTVLYLPMLMRTYSISGRVINAFGQGVANVRGWSNVSGFSDPTDGSGFYAINNAVAGSNFVQITGTTGFPASPDSAPAFNPEFRLPVLPPSAVNQDFVWRDDNPCRAIDAQPGVNYVVNRTDPADAFDFLRLNVTGTTPLVITMTNVQSPGQLQLRGPIKNVNDCSPTTGTDLVSNYFKVFSPTAGTTNQVLNVGSIPGGLYFARFNLDAGATRSATPYNFAWAFGNTSNNNSCSAQGVSLGAVVQETPDDAEDWFFFDVGSPSTIVITMTNFTATGQYNILRQTNSTDCTQFTWPPLLVQNGTSNLTTMTLFNQPAGRYFFRVATTGGFNSTPYNFRVTATAGGTVATVDTCSAFQGCGQCAEWRHFDDLLARHVRGVVPEDRAQGVGPGWLQPG